MLSGGNSCAEHKGQGRGSAQGRVSGTPESREFQTAGISDPSQRGCSGEGRRGGPGKHCQQSPGALELRGWGWFFPSTSVDLGNREALGQGSSAALLLIQTQIQNEALGKTSKGK